MSDRALQAPNLPRAGRPVIADTPWSNEHGRVKHLASPGRTELPSNLLAMRTYRERRRSRAKPPIASRLSVAGSGTTA